MSGVSDQNRVLYRFELEPEVRDWLDGLSDSDFKRVDEICGMLAEEAPGLAARGQIICKRRMGATRPA